MQSAAPDIPDHKLIRRIGVGSYGEVWLAQNDLGRFRAVKIVFVDRFKERGPFEREFAGIRQFEPISRSHDALVDVLHVGDARGKGYFYYVMEVADDLRLGQAIDPESYVPNTLAQQIHSRGRLPHQECIRLGLSLSSGLAHLHESGLIHRDIKPSNVVFIDGKAKIVDLGLVTAINDAASWVGTQGFIPPEGPGAAQGDIYSLGKTLYEAASGRDRQQFPELPTQLGDATSEREFLEFNEVLVKACHPAAAQRYRRMRDLHAELQVLAEGQSLRRLRALERRINLGKKAVLTAAALILVAALPVFHFVSVGKAKREARQRQVGTEVAYGSRDVSEGSFLTSLPRFAEALRVELGNPEREAVHKLRIESALLFAPRLLHTIDLGGDIHNVEFNEDGSRLFATRYFHSVHTLDLDSGERIGKPVVCYGARSSALSRDGRTLIVGTEENYALIVDLESGQERQAFRQPERVMALAFHPTLNRIVTACNDGKARVWDPASGEMLLELSGHTGGVLDAKFSPDGDYVLTTSKDSSARVWNSGTGESVAVFKGHTGWVLHGNFHPNRDWVVTSSHDGSARVWRHKTAEPIGRPLLHRDSAANARFSPDGRYIVTAGHDGSARLWDCITWHPATRNPVLPHSAKVRDAAFSPDGRRIATASFDGILRIWDLSEVGVPAQPLAGIFSGDMKWSATLTNRVMEIRQFPNGGEIARAISFPSEPLDAALDERGQTVTASFKGAGARRVMLWNVGSDSPKEFIVSATNTLGSIITSANGSVAACVYSNEVTVTKFGSDAKTTFTQTNIVDAFALSADERFLATAEESGVYLWNLEAPGPARYFPSSRKPYALRFSHDSTKLAVATSDIYYNPCFAQVFDTRTGAAITPPLNHEDGVVAVSFASDSSLLVTAGEDLCAKIWRADTGAQVGPPLLHDRQVRLASFCAEDRFIATLDRGGMVRLFEASAGDPITPPFAGAPLRPKFLGLNGNLLICVDAAGKATAWQLPSTSTESSKLLEIADYLTSRAKVSDQRLNALKSLPVFASYLKVTPEQAAQWHLREAEEARAENNENAAQFHFAAALKNSAPASALRTRINERMASAR